MPPPQLPPPPSSQPQLTPPPPVANRDKGWNLRRGRAFYVYERSLCFPVRQLRFVLIDGSEEGGRGGLSGWCGRVQDGVTDGKGSLTRCRVAGMVWQSWVVSQCLVRLIWQGCRTRHGVAVVMCQGWSHRGGVTRGEVAGLAWVVIAGSMVL